MFVGNIYEVDSFDFPDQASFIIQLWPHYNNWD